MNTPSFTPEEFAEAQRKLGLSDAQLANMLGFENPQHIRRLRAPETAPHGKRVMPHTARLLRAYLDGYRPADWPIESAEATSMSTTERRSIEQRLKALEDRVFKD